MLFNSYIFIFLFMPVTLAVYFLTGKFNNRKLSNGLLLIASLVFLFYRFNYIGIISVLISIAFNYAIYRLLIMDKLERHKKVLLFIGVAVNASTLMLLKYYNTVIYHIDQLRHVDFVERSLILPLGISFYTFQQIAFLVDTYRGEVEPVDLLDYSLYVSYFPRIVSGPIVNHNQFLPQLKDSSKLKFQWDNFNKGLYRFSVGLAKKVLVADVLAAPASTVVSA